MQSPMVKAALERLQPASGYELVKARLEQEADGTEFVVLLLDYGIGGVKKYRVPVSDLQKEARPEKPKPAPAVEQKEVKTTARAKARSK